jgi:hypothetical protein
LASEKLQEYERLQMIVDRVGTCGNRAITGSNRARYLFGRRHTIITPARIFGFRALVCK